MISILLIAMTSFAFASPDMVCDGALPIRIDSAVKNLQVGHAEFARKDSTDFEILSLSGNPLVRVYPWFGIDKKFLVSKKQILNQKIVFSVSGREIDVRH